MHTTHIMHTWDEVQLQRIVLDSYVWIPTFVARETSNDRFTIPEPVLLNPRIWHTSRIHGTRCSFEELRGISMSQFPPLLLRKWAMTGSLFQNLFCQLQAKCKWLTILKSLKRKTNKANSRIHQPNIQMCSYEFKRIYIYGVHLGLLPQTSSGGLRL